MHLIRGTQEVRVKPNTMQAVQSIGRQRGIGVLLVAIVLLGIVTVMTLFSLAAGVYETRTTTNESRYKLAYQTAETGLDHGLEFVKSNTGLLASCWIWPGMSQCTAGETARWTRCAANDQTTPCGAIEPTGANATNSTIRSNYFYYSDANGRAVGADPKTLNLSLSPVVTSSGTVGQLVTTMDNFPVDYEVNALLCLIDTVTPGNQCLTQSEFTSTYGSGTTPSTSGSVSSTGYGANNFSSSGLFAVTLVSRSRLVSATTAVDADTENAQVVLKATTATYRIIGSSPDVPLIASGSVTGLGNAEIVVAPNAGGTGVPLSIWTPSCIHVTKNDPCGGNSDASFATCYADEFFQTGGSNTGTCGAPSSGAPCQYDGSTTCKGGGSGCSCSAIANMVGNGKSPYGLGALSGHYAGNTVAGPDLLGKNVGGILPDVQYFPLSPLNIPPNQMNNSLFEYAFGVHVADSNSILLDTDGNGIDDATDYEQSNFTDITSNGGCGGLSSTSQGFLYTTKGVGCSLANGQIGTPLLPLVLVVQGDLDFGAQTTFFGLIFVRSDAGIGGSLVTSPGYSVRATGSPQLYGAMIIEGSPTITGSPQIIYDKNVLNNVVNGPNNTRMGILPGSWSDAGRIDVTTQTYSEN
jgi:Tfp pilus assembly protein PilX